MNTQDHKTGGTDPLAVGAATDVGKARDENEDAYGCFSPRGREGQLLIVADGMGGHTRGREASRTAVATIRDVYFDRREGSVLDRLRHAFEQANEAVRTGAEGHFGTPGTTATALVAARNQLYLAHVGDSRAYRLEPDACDQLTVDHTVARKLERQKDTADTDPSSHPRSEALTRALGAEARVDVDVAAEGSVRPGDCFLLCTDGLRAVSDSALQEAASGGDPQTAAQHLVEQAVEQDGSDNVTAIVARRV